MTVASKPALRVGARILLLNPVDEVLLIHARDPEDPGHHWWNCPGGGQEPGEKLVDTARREIAEATGLVVDEIGRKLWTRESTFTYRGREHHRLDHVYLARTDDTAPRTATRHTTNERAGLIERRWWCGSDLADCRDKLLPAQLPDLLRALLDDRFPRSLALTACDSPRRRGHIAGRVDAWRFARETTEPPGRPAAEPSTGRTGHELPQPPPVSGRSRGADSRRRRGRSPGWPSGSSR
ncbi:NUDIX hydrolase [Amycolatopsis sp. CA-128772]|uniref:NUDIX hydrolase n=1 Tax=Amycolatopsis sp. CA-128772 TaxID=2073159 RepID=UPI000CD1AEC0|nr:NUDIX domain-containing protein [Amycolatopsis sp. CA-128772]